MVKIYESPDGGHTVYERETGSTERKLLSIDEVALDKYNNIEWNKIWWQRNSNPALKKAVEQVIILYRLSKENE
jgi:hypothetical protein